MTIPPIIPLVAVAVAVWMPTASAGNRVAVVVGNSAIPTIAQSLHDLYSDKIIPGSVSDHAVELLNGRTEFERRARTLIKYRKGQ